MDRNKAFSFTANCFNGESASCGYACPFRLDLRSFMKKAAKGRWDAAYKELRAVMLFPSVVTAFCARPCQNFCQRSTVLGGAPISVGLIEQSCLRLAKKKEPVSYAVESRPERVAIVGAGPAGLSCALLLAQKRFAVTVFDKNDGWGGSLREHPDFAQFNADFTMQFSVVEADFRFGTTIKSLGELDAWDAVFIATGKEGDDFGMRDTCGEKCGASKEIRVFTGGELVGLSLIDGMAGAASAAKAMEAFLLSGSRDSAPEPVDKSGCGRYAPHPNTPDIAGIIPADGETYSGDEAKAEAARCMLCDCDACMSACELLERYKKKPPRISNDVFLDGQSRNSVSSACITRQTWSCNLCLRCASKCGEGCDIGGLFRYSRSDRVRSGNYPPALHEYWLREMVFASGEGSFAASAPGQEGCELAFFPGCRLGMSNPGTVSRVAAHLREKHGAGILLNCCGAPAFWAGDDAMLQSHLKILSGQWELLGKPKLITACATCERMLQEYLPQIEFASVYELLTGDAFPSAASVFESASVFDPCAALGKDSLKRAVRELASSLGTELSAFDSDGKCCGFGGHMQLANPSLYAEIVANRAAESETPYIVYCANCREVFAAQGKRCEHILDLLFDNIPDSVPTLAEKRENIFTLKKNLAAEHGLEPFEPEREPWEDMSVTVSREAQAKMERGLITLGDVLETIRRAELSGEGFVSESGEYLCEMTGAALTYWVRYSKEADCVGRVIISVTDVYAHRMRVRDE